MKRLPLKIMELTSLAALAALMLAAVAGVFWTGGVHGRWGDLLLGVHPGQIRVGWSQDWANESRWAHLRFDRRTSGPALGFLGGQTFTSVAPHEIAIDFPVWLVALPVIVTAVVSRRRLAALPRVPCCARCGYPIGSSDHCTECGASLRSRDS